MRVFLIGLTGAGKSTIGKMLAEKLSYSFVDLDDVIRFETGRDIEDIFEKEGEEYFRLLESNYLKKSSFIDKQVIATGGGAPCFHKNMEFIKNNGLSIFLYTPVDIVTERLFQSDATQRPMLKNKSKEQLKAFLQQKLAERLPFYSQADFSINTELAESAAKITSLLIVIIRLLEQEKASFRPQQ